MELRSLLGLFSLCSSIVSTAATSTGFTVELGDVQYFLPPKVIATVSADVVKRCSFGTELFVPFTAVKSDGYETSDIASISARYLEGDDVFQEAFLSALYIQASIAKSANASATIITGETDLPSGPYFLSATGQVYEAWRLYSDTQGTFTEAVIATSDSSYAVLPAGTVGQKHAIAVPSRLYFTKTEEKPLAGVRIGIKDIYDIKGLRTSNGNRAWYWLYPPANATATPVQKLIDAGAIIVGKMITSQFANGEVATADWVDYHEAFNPRGDGYQDTSSSSSGGGAATAAYSWLDISLGSDTGGSVRNPAQVQGVYGNRPSHGLVGLEHTMPLSPTLDTPGLLARNPLLWAEAAKVMYEPNITFTTAYPSSIKALYWPTEATTPGAGLAIDFLANLTSFLNATTTPLNLSTAWKAENPTLLPSEIMFNETYAVFITKEQIPLVRDPFFAKYALQHNGRTPFIDPVPKVRWNYGLTTPQTLDAARANKTVFMSWFNKSILPPSESTCSESLMLYVGTDGSIPSPRNVYLDDPKPPAGFGRNSMSGFSEAPDFVVPIGEVPYESSITNHTEYLPVAINFMAAKGCDGMLFSLIGDLYHAGILKEAQAGQSGITGGEILFKRDF
ncbi:hypothetical protein N0V90_007478 [Kalmusia sp. IMI 367209]|nr:hypothetical protein N0V90_007478 [Kalmusia sp. IMI 367209]